MGNIKDVSDVIKLDSATEITNLQNSTNPNLKIAGEVEADSKRKMAEIKNKSITLLHRLIVGNGGKKIQDNISYLSEENKKRLENKILRVVDIDIKLGDIPTIGSSTEGLIYVQDEPDLKEMFENLIVNTIDKNKKSTTHPSFVEILKQFNSDDAYYFKNIFQKYFSFMDKIENDKDKIEMLFSISKSELYYRYKCSENDITSEDKLKDNTMYIDEKLGNEYIPEEVLDNWERLGLISVEREMDSLTDVGGQWIADVIKAWSDSRIVKLKKFGFNFAKAVSVIN